MFSRNSFKNLVCCLAVMKKQLNKSDVEPFNQQIQKDYGISDFFSKKDRVVLVEENNLKYLTKDNVPVFFFDGGRLVPTLKFVLQNPVGKIVVVDMGAVKFVASGADVMRPGIVEFDPSIEQEDVVVVVDQTHKKPLCVAKALMSSNEMSESKTGKALKSLHHVGDAVWNIQ
jgi:PUA domain protein